MNVLLTGCAGFIGSSIAERLLSDGHRVIGIDCYTPYYSQELKQVNIERLRSSRNFELHQIDLSSEDLSDLVSQSDAICHQAGQPGVRNSWGAEFNDYLAWNVTSTRRLLEAAQTHSQLQVFVAASSSSVYGEQGVELVSESRTPRPISPYGVSKLAAEHLCTLFGTQFRMPTVSLRYFTVYGPRQRPDMAMNRLLRCALKKEEFVMFGDGSQVRDFTYIDDVVNANVAALNTPVPPGSVLNIGGGSPTNLITIIEMIEALTGMKVETRRNQVEKGDPTSTKADCSLAQSLLGWSPSMSLREGLRRQLEQVASNLHFYT